ncbi:S24 family peptidase [uncultured Anaerococcus sp.]|uniref:LexA family protein n=1 Tax=uncultured Anaerococcus sp. TaxID=293428 RepID=UPI002805BB4C|nr:S24 family peptidase [uncultured Anaerococcus sp.]
MATIGDNIKTLREDRDLSQTEVASKIGVSKQTLFKYENDIIQNIPTKYIEKLANLFDVSPGYIMGWQNKNGRPILDKIPGIKVTKNLITVPILGHIQCGMPVLSECNYEGYFKLDPELCKADFSLVADGDSMIDANIHEGDIVFFKETPDVESGTIAAVLLDDQTTLKKVIKMDDTLILQPANDAYKPILVKQGEYNNIMILGKMVGVFSKRDK